jgi:hypothetical protein
VLTTASEPRARVARRIVKLPGCTSPRASRRKAVYAAAATELALDAIEHSQGKTKTLIALRLT